MRGIIVLNIRRKTISYIFKYRSMIVIRFVVSVGWLRTAKINLGTQAGCPALRPSCGVRFNWIGYTTTTAHDYQLSI